MLVVPTGFFTLRTKVQFVKSQILQRLRRLIDRVGVSDNTSLVIALGILTLLAYFVVNNLYLAVAVLGCPTAFGYGN